MGIAVRPAGRRARLSAARRPGALPRPTSSSSPPSTPAELAEQLGPPGGLRAALPGALGRGLSTRPASDSPPLRRTRILIVVGFGVFVFLGISRDAGPRAERDRHRALARARGRRGAGARRRARGAARARPPARAQPACVAATDDVRGQAQAPGRRRDPPVPPERPAPADDAAPAPAAWPGARAAGLPVVQCVRVRRDGPLSGARRRAALDLRADRQRGELPPSEPRTCRRSPC